MQRYFQNAESTRLRNLIFKSIFGRHQIIHRQFWNRRRDVPGHHTSDTHPEPRKSLEEKIIESGDERRIFGELVESFNKYLSHTSPSSDAITAATEAKMQEIAERKSPVHQHYRAVMSVLDEIISYGSEERENKARQAVLEAGLPQRKWISARQQVRSCLTDRDYLKVFERYFIRGELDKTTALKILWARNLKDMDTILQIRRIVLNSGNLSGWSANILSAFDKEINIRLAVAQEQKWRADKTTKTRLPEWDASLAYTFEHTWIHALESGQLSNDAARSLWYLVANMNYQFELLGNAVNKWALELALSESNIDSAIAVQRVNAVVQMWITGITTGNRRLIDLASIFCSTVPVKYIPPTVRLAIDFCDALESQMSPTSRKAAASVAGLFKRQGELKDIVVVITCLDALDFVSGRDLAQGSLAAEKLLDFVANHAVLSKRKGRLSDTLVLQRVKKLAERVHKQGGNTTGNKSDEVVFEVA
ncbi:uncharacterized protein V1516DRAFT_181620 [Lipomyces oligophaga]|uniref:uncharacterized protein n=1 Tax=Lipomyces oligophaga TaxID=45792 RepID=UPI0034CF7301